jgi:hypothetical protein
LLAFQASKPKFYPAIADATIESTFLDDGFFSDFGMGGVEGDGLCRPPL